MLSAYSVASLSFCHGPAAVAPGRYPTSQTMDMFKSLFLQKTCGNITPVTDAAGDYHLFVLGKDGYEQELTAIN